MRWGSAMSSVLNINRSLGGSRYAHRSFNVIIGVLPLGKGFKTTHEDGNTAILAQFAEACAGEQSMKWAKF
jgi:hypothetical protein